MRTCAGFLDLYGAGIVIPLWSDLQITVRQDGSYSWIFADRTSSITDHPTVMMGDIKERTRCSHAKILSPWAFSCKEDIKWHYTQPLWNQDMGNDFAIVPGVIDFKYQHTTSTNIFLRVPKIGEKGIFLKRNTPLAHLVPMSDRPLKIYNHMVSEEEYLKLVSANAVGTFVRRYLSDRKIRESQEQNKCPFSWMR
jgi:hypothetical protein